MSELPHGAQPHRNPRGEETTPRWVFALCAAVALALLLVILHLIGKVPAVHP